jgi:contact-dependent growth inhibition (CDI) system CdiI-like immunity protein
MTDDPRRGAYLFDAYFQDTSEPHADWESVVLQFMQSEPGELVRQTHDSLVRLLKSSNDAELVEHLFAPVPLNSYRPKSENLTARAWIEEIVLILADGVPRAMNSIARERRRAVSIARAVLTGKLDVLVGARDLGGLRIRLGVPDDDPDFECFLLIESETDALPLADERSTWSADALIRLAPEIARATKWATDLGWEAFQNVVRRFETAG